VALIGVKALSLADDEEKKLDYTEGQNITMSI